MHVCLYNVEIYKLSLSKSRPTYFSINPIENRERYFKVGK